MKPLDPRTAAFEYFQHGNMHVPHAISLASIAGIIGVGVLASVLVTRREEEEARNMEMQKQSGEPPPEDPAALIASHAGRVMVDVDGRASRHHP